MAKLHTIEEFYQEKMKWMPDNLKKDIGHYYADKSIEFDKSALIFSNSQIPYNTEALGGSQAGFFCIFTEAFFDQFGHIRDYPIFKPGGTPIFFLDDEQVRTVKAVFER